jgi:hypothetical protein
MAAVLATSARRVNVDLLRLPVLVESHRRPRREAAQIRGISGIGHQQPARLSVASPGASLTTAPRGALTIPHFAKVRKVAKWAGFVLDTGWILAAGWQLSV